MSFAFSLLSILITYQNENTDHFFLIVSDDHYLCHIEVKDKFIIAYRYIFSMKMIDLKDQ